MLPEWSEAAHLALREASVPSSAPARSARRSPPTSPAPGVGRLGIVDERRRVSNLHRQPLHFTPDLGAPKAQNAAAKLRFLDPEIVVEPYPAR